MVPESHIEPKHYQYKRRCVPLAKDVTLHNKDPVSDKNKSYLSDYGNKCTDLNINDFNGVEGVP